LALQGDVSDVASAGTPKKNAIADMSREDLIKYLTKLVQKNRKLEEGTM
jgi:hypothetical protein